LRRTAHLGRWLPVLVWGAAISTFSTSLFTGENTAIFVVPFLSFLFPHATHTDLIAMHYAIRKLAHFTEYAILSVLLYRALRNGPGWSLRAAVIAVAMSALYSVLDEAHQWFVPGRTAAATDCLIDVSGAAAGQGLLAFSGRGQRA
jgi:VanZ family protein